MAQVGPDGNAYLLGARAEFDSIAKTDLEAVDCFVGFARPRAGVTLTEPMGGVTDLPQGADLDIAWTGETPQAVMDIWLLGPAGWWEVAQDVVGTLESYTIPTAGLMPGYYMVAAEVTDAGPPCVVASLGPVRLTLPAAPPAPAGAGLAAQEVVWRSPSHAGQRIPVGKSFEIRWELSLPTELAGNVSLWIRRGTSDPWTLLAPDVGAEVASFPWDTATAAEGEYQFALTLSLDALTLLGQPSPWLQLL